MFDEIFIPIPKSSLKIESEDKKIISSSCRRFFLCYSYYFIVVISNLGYNEYNGNSE